MRKIATRHNVRLLYRRRLNYTISIRSPPTSIHGSLHLRHARRHVRWMRHAESFSRSYAVSATGRFRCAAKFSQSVAFLRGDIVLTVEEMGGEEAEAAAKAWGTRRPGLS